MVYNNNFSIKTKGHCDIINITNEVVKIINESNITDANVLVYCPGSTCGITTTEFEPGAVHDMKSFFEKLIPENNDYKHNLTWGDDNGGAHLRASLIGPSLSLPVVDGKLVLGTWQKIVLIDFDTSPRERKVVVSLLHNSNK